MTSVTYISPPIFLSVFAGNLKGIKNNKNIILEKVKNKVFSAKISGWGSGDMRKEGYRDIRKEFAYNMIENCN